MSSPICPCRTRAGDCAPVAASAKRICTSRARSSRPFRRKAEPASRVMRRVISIWSASLKPCGARRSELSMRSATSAKWRAGRLAEPAKITSSIPSPRMAVGRVSPMTQRIASSRFDLPQPFGPTTPVSPSRMGRSVGSTKLLNPFSRRRSKRTQNPLPQRHSGRTQRLAVRAEMPTTFCASRRKARRKAGVLHGGGRTYIHIQM